jgi:glycogen synthase
VIASTKVGGARDLIRPDENGWTFRSGDRRDLQMTLERAIDRGKAGLRAMGETAQQRCGQFSSEASAHCIGEAILAHPLPAST